MDDSRVQPGTTRGPAVGIEGCAPQLLDRALPEMALPWSTLDRAWQGLCPAHCCPWATKAMLLTVLPHSWVQDE